MKTLYPKEKETIRTFVFEFTKKLQKLQDCQNYLDVKNTVEEMSIFLDDSNCSNNFNTLCKKIDKELD